MNRTEVNFLSSFSNLEINEKHLFIGSCFAENIGRKFTELHMDATINPFGVIFHPISLFQLINRSLMDSPFESEDFFEFNDYWFNYEISSKCAKFEKKDALDFANKKLKDLKSELMSADRLFLTFGSSILRSFKGKPVANCHKQNSQIFKKKISKSSEMLSYIEPVLKKLFKYNSSLKVLISVSPVRHSKEGMVENSLSKSNLVVLCDELKTLFDNIEYLPVYELVIDELRDYSFFSDDLVHPNTKTIEEVWKRLKKKLGSEKFIDFCNQSQKLLLSINHESIYPQSKQNLIFQNNLLNSILVHESKYGIGWPLEKKIIKNRLKFMA